ncbi:cation:proton antiporter [Candidatus Nitrosopumilus sp. SW]|uniref:cation:proton antiporter n=1 Tax=Candidatus Nitrosopumilus sp. SW TaxID=2508726 RepID=UPI0016396B40|nr:cation:proton antiporter [Candidatus Nitrosopumilus sp. SW]
MAEEFVFNVLILLVSAVILGEVFKRLKLPAMVGHLLAGVIVGPTLLNLVHTDESFLVFIDLAVFFLMFLAGLELHPEEIKKAGKKAMILSLLAFSIPFLGTFGIMHVLDQPLVTSLFVSLTLAITAVPVSAVVLMEFGLLKSKLGTTVMTAGIINDILSLVILAIILQMSVEPTTSDVDVMEVLISTGKIVAFIGGIFLVDFLLSKFSRHIPTTFIPIFSKLKTRESGFAILLIVTFTISVIAELSGLHFIIGTFFAGLIIYRKLIGKEHFETINDVYGKITFGFFSPVFFAFIGAELHAQSLSDVLPLFLLLLGIAIAGKIGGGFLGAKLAGFSTSKSKTIGYLMNSRGMVELVIAVIGLEAGIIDHTLFSVIVAIGFITTVLAPIMSRFSLKHSKEATI